MQVAKCVNALACALVNALAKAVKTPSVQVSRVMTTMGASRLLVFVGGMQIPPAQIAVSDRQH